MAALDRAVALGARGPGPGHDRGPGGLLRRAEGPGLPGRAVSARPRRRATWRRASAPTGRCHGATGPGRRPRLRAAGPRPGHRGDRQLGHVLPGLPRSLRCQARSCRGASGPPAAGAVTWAISAEHADRLAPGGAPGPCSRSPRSSTATGSPAVFGTPAAVRAHHRRKRERTRRRRPCPRRHRTPRAGGPADHRHGACRGAGPDEPGGPGGGAGGMPDDLPGRAAIAAADALLEAWPAEEKQAWLARPAVVRVQPAAGRRRPAVGGWLSSGAASGRAEPGPAHLIGPAVDYWRELATVSDRILGRGTRTP